MTSWKLVALDLPRTRHADDAREECNAHRKAGRVPQVLRQYRTRVVLQSARAGDAAFAKSHRFKHDRNKRQQRECGKQRVDDVMLCGVMA